ncbi:LOW QUALITY PROTEIN: rho GTPase-activating protein 12-like [Alosa alosa]|uniref:LOW QUALITY PROTEIN: rho GTPase-activating protein 12-like n=1 Tax=Alosa alosa TaxID=278164 RepID=UPI0020151842|nr:LOW QUALITY PROTEIN: rho GTPase-activating protein 12-like [Alosa alosa]
MAEVSIAPGKVYVEVEYDYEYKSRDRLISIRQGECFLLLKKTNEDWWQVRAEDGGKAFYVPAQYVREARRALMPPPQKPLLPPAPVPAPRRPSSLKEHTHGRKEPPNTHVGHGQGSLKEHPHAHTHAEMPSPASSPTSEKVPLMPPSGGGGAAQQQQPVWKHGSLPRTRASSPQRPPEEEEGRDRERGRERDGERERGRERDGERERGRGGDRDHGKSRNESSSGDELSSSSTEHLQPMCPSSGQRPDSPVYTNLAELKLSSSSLPPVPCSPPLHTHGAWETHRHASGRHYYYNTHTQERRWKPPRTRTDHHTLATHSPGTESKTLSSEEVCLSTYSSQSDSLYGSPPRGWSEELDEYGHTLYVCDYTNEKWIKHTDDQGRQYYYSADGSRSEWELPKLVQIAGLSPAPTQDTHKTRSLDRRQPEPIVLTKWRHSAHVPENDKPSEKCGVLNVTKITENGKKVRKNWTSSWTVLQGSSLLFAKSQGGGTSWFGSHQSKPELSVDLKGASVEWAKDKSSKKHVFEVKTHQGTELLMQSDNESLINEWLHAITEAINTHVIGLICIEEDMPESPSPEKHDHDKDLRDSKKLRGMKSSSSMDVSDHRKRTKLKKFLTRRPTLQAVRDKGYIKDQVFGCSLTSLCQRENGTVPHFVRMCIDHVEKNGLSVDGLYRVSGNLAVVQKLRFAINHDERVDLEDGKWEDIHVTTGAFKMFFRELPEPLFTYTHFQEFVNAIKIPDYRQRVQSMKELVKQLPRANHDTMQALFTHLRRVVEHGEENRMTAQSVAIVFGPTLLRPETESWNMAVHMVYQNQIVELVLLELDTIFSR